MAKKTRGVTAHAPEAPTKTTPNRVTSQEVLDWAQSFHHETPPMFRRKLEEAGNPRGNAKAAQKLVDYESDSEEESTNGETQGTGTAITTSPTAQFLSIRSMTAGHQDVGRPASIASDPGPDRGLKAEERRRLEKTASTHPTSANELKTAEDTQQASANKFQLNFAGPAYPTVLQPSLPNLTQANDPSVIAARRLAKYQSFDADDGFLQTHLYSIADRHFGPRFHTRFSIKTIGTIMCDQCKQKNNGEMYKCHTCTNQICRSCVEDRLQREKDERENPPAHGEEPYKWEWNGMDRHEGFKLCYLQRKEKSNGQGDYSIAFVGIADGKDPIEGKIEMIMSDVQGGRKRKEPPAALDQKKIKLDTTKAQYGLPTPSNRAPSMESERVQHMVFGKASTTLAKLTRMQEAAQVAAADSTDARNLALAGSKPAKRSQRHGSETLEREQQQKMQYDPQMLQAQMFPAAALDYSFPSRRIQIPAASPDSVYTAGGFEEVQRRRHVAPPWDGRGLPPYEYHPYRDVNRRFSGARQPPATQKQSSGIQSKDVGTRGAPETAFDTNLQPQFVVDMPPPWTLYGQTYLMADAERFQAQMHAHQFQAHAAAVHQMQVQGMPMHAASSGARDRGRVSDSFRNPFEVVTESFSDQPAAEMPSFQPADTRPATRAAAELAESFDPSSMLPDDPTIFIPPQYRARSEGDYTRWDALIHAANVMYQLDLSKLDGVAVGQLTPAQFDALRQAAKLGQQQAREQVARKARESVAAGDAVVIDDDDEEDDDEGRDTESEKGRYKRGMNLWDRSDVDGGRLRSGKEFTS